MQDPYLASVLEMIASLELNANGPHLISVDELRAAGALDVPAAWRKSLGVERGLLPLFGDDDDVLPEQQDPTASDPSVDESADERP